MWEYTHRNVWFSKLHNKWACAHWLLWHNCADANALFSICLLHNFVRMTEKILDKTYTLHTQFFNFRLFFLWLVCAYIGISYRFNRTISFGTRWNSKRITSRILMYHNFFFEFIKISNSVHGKEKFSIWSSIS